MLFLLGVMGALVAGSVVMAMPDGSDDAAFDARADETEGNASGEYGAGDMLDEAGAVESAQRDSLARSDAPPVATGHGDVQEPDAQDPAFDMSGAVDDGGFETGSESAQTDVEALLARLGLLADSGAAEDADLATLDEIPQPTDPALDVDDGPGLIVNGTEAADWTDGTAATDILGGAAGDDVLRGLGGDDSLFGAEGDDTITGDGGADTLLGGDGADRMAGGADADSLLGGMGADTLSGGDADDTLQGGMGDDALLGGAGDDALLGREGSDILWGDTGADTLQGGDGADLLVGWRDGAGDFLNGNAGADTLAIGAGDVATGGAGEDTFLLDAWLDAVDEGAAPGQIMDYEPERDQIILIYDGADADPPEVSLRASATLKDVTEILADGEVVSRVSGEAAPALSDIAVLSGDDAMAAITSAL